MRADALDRVGTKLEKRFTKHQIVTMLESARLKDIRFSETEPTGSAPQASLIDPAGLEIDLWSNLNSENGIAQILAPRRDLEMEPDHRESMLMIPANL
jgi:hypothetical protein